MTSAKPSASPATQLAGFIAKFEPAMAKRIRAARATLRRRLPTAIEIVYDNYNFFVIGYSATERPSDCIVSLACNSKNLGLSFYYRATLPDSQGILLGGGSQNRFIRLESAATLSKPAVEALIRAAIAQAKTPLAKTGGRHHGRVGAAPRRHPETAPGSVLDGGSTESPRVADDST